MTPFLYYIVSAVLLLRVAAQECQNTDYGRECLLSFEPKTFEILGSRILLGAEDVLVSLNAQQLEVEQSVDMRPEADLVNRCTLDFGIVAADCKNFIRVIQPLPAAASGNGSMDDRVLVCGTNAYFPSCNLHDAANLTQYVDMTPTDDTDEGFCPHSNANDIVALFASNSRFYSATHFTPLVSQKTIGIAPNPLQGDSTFTVKTPSSDPLWLNKPDFVSVYEIGEHIYFFLREEAYEVNAGEPVVYSRAVRFCKSDDGIGSSETFLTFQKARIKCTNGPGNERGTIPFTYDNLQATFLWESEDGTETFLYGVFSAPPNGPEGAAICKFSFDPDQTGSLTQVFEDGEYNVLDSNNPDTWIREITTAFTCPTAGGNQRSPQDALRYLLTYNPVTSEMDSPLHTVSCNTFTTIAVDIIEYRGSKQEIFYYTMANGEIRQLVITEEGAKYEHVITDIGDMVKELIMHKNEDETRSVFATTEDRLVSIHKGACSRYESCFACHDSKDAYCGWDPDTNTCISKLSNQGPQVIEVFRSSEEGIVSECGSRASVDPVPTARPMCTVARVSDTSTESPQSGSDGGNEADCIPVSLGVSNDNERKALEISVPELIGVSLGGFLGGIPVGLIVCGIFCAVCIRRKKRQDRQHKAITISLSNGTSRSPQTNNKLDQEQVQKKEQQMVNHPPRYVQTGPFPPPSSSSITAPTIHTNPSASSSSLKPLPSQDVNQYFSPDEGDDDVIMPLPSNPGFHRQTSAPLTSPTAKQPPFSSQVVGNGGSLPRRKVPGHRVPRGRTDSTTWLRANSESSELSSPTSPLELQEEIML